MLMLQSGGTFAEYSKASINIQGTAFLVPPTPHPQKRGGGNRVEKTEKEEKNHEVVLYMISLLEAYGEKSLLPCCRH